MLGIVCRTGEGGHQPANNLATRTAVCQTASSLAERIVTVHLNFPALRTASRTWQTHAGGPTTEA